jgi:HD-GYP domain-containing protein (c-di-GMP phosphodiesterase class II)
LRDEEIDLNARIFAVADAFDAITSDRVYRRGRSYEEAAAELEEYAARQFDPTVVEAFHRVPRVEWDEIRRRSLELHERRATARRIENVAEHLYIGPKAGALVN